MTSRKLGGIVAGALATFVMTKGAAAATVVNCIGEQTTITGEGVANATQLWPQQLGMQLGATYTVNNDGVNGGKVIDGSAESATSKTGMPAIIVIGPYAEHDYAASITQDAWTTAYKKLVNDYLALTPQPTIYVMTPPPAAFVYQSAAEQTFATGIVKTAVLSVAGGNNSANKQLKVIDLFSDAALGMTADSAGDGHFNAAGHKEVATLAYKCIAMGMCGSGVSGGGGSGGGGGTTGAGGTTGTGGATGTGGTGAGGNTATGGTTGSTGGTTGSTGGTTGSTGGTTGSTGGTTGSTGGDTGNAGGDTGSTGTGGTTTTPSGGTTGTASGGSTGSAGGTTGTTGERSSGGCAVAGDAAGLGGLAGVSLALALALGRARRRR
ncbi:MAG TPA: hypothetical protein VHJ20_00050 [Polyangia bacterium]|nr:hypothetical protein [Polyangia bacterium]